MLLLRSAANVVSFMTTTIKSQKKILYNQKIVKEIGTCTKVPGAGVEPARPQRTQDFKSCVSTNSTIRACWFLEKRNTKQVKKKAFNSLKAFGAKDEIRTRDPDLGKVVLYQLSYFRMDWNYDLFNAGMSNKVSISECLSCKATQR